jgi:hypothetical protein
LEQDLFSAFTGESEKEEERRIKNAARMQARESIFFVMIVLYNLRRMN